MNAVLNHPLVCTGAGLKASVAVYGQHHIFCLEPGPSTQEAKGIGSHALETHPETVDSWSDSFILA